MGWLDERSFLNDIIQTQPGNAGYTTNGDLIGNLLLPGLYTQYNVGRNLADAEGARQAGPAPTKPQAGLGGQQPLDDEYAQLLALLKGELDPNSEAGRRYIGIATGAAYNDAKQRGIMGGLSGANTQQAALNAAYQFRGQGLDRYAGALGQASNRNLQQQQINFTRQQAANQQYEQAMKEWNERRAGPLRMIGGALGTAAGSFLGPGGSAAGAQIGSGLGGSLSPYKNPYDTDGVY